MQRSRLLISASLATALCLGAAPALAGTAPRAWVSGHGVDQAGCGAPTAPCRSLQYVHDSIVGPGGEIDILDPAGYGAITITKALSIVNDGAGVAGVQASGSTSKAILINAGPNDAVFLKGLTVDGLNSAAVGIDLDAGGNLTVIDCVVRHFSGYGVSVGAAGGTVTFLVANTVVTDNSVAGIYILASGSSSVNLYGAVDHTIIENNGPSFGTGVTTDLIPTGGNISLSFTNDLIANNGYGLNNEVFASNLADSAEILIRDSSFDNNRLHGLVDQGNGNVRLSHSTFNGNGEYGVYSSPNTGLVYSYGDNTIDGNVFGAVHGVLTPDGPQ